MIVIIFFFFLRPDKYTDMPSESTLFWLLHVQVFVDKVRIDLATVSLE